MSFKDKIVSSWTWCIITNPILVNKSNWKSRFSNKSNIEPNAFIEQYRRLMKLQLWLLNVKRVCEMSFHLITLPAFKKCKWNV